VLQASCRRLLKAPQQTSTILSNWVELLACLNTLINLKLKANHKFSLYSFAVIQKKSNYANRVHKNVNTREMKTQFLSFKCRFCSEELIAPEHTQQAHTSYSKILAHSNRILQPHMMWNTKQMVKLSFRFVPSLLAHS